MNPNTLIQLIRSIIIDHRLESEIALSHNLTLQVEARPVILITAKNLTSTIHI